MSFPTLRDPSDAKPSSPAATCRNRSFVRAKTSRLLIIFLEKEIILLRRSRSMVLRTRWSYTQKIHP